MPKPIVVLAEGDAYMVVHKPAGLLMLSTAKESERTLVAYLQQQFTDAPFKLHPCHRLDRETSGVVLFAKGKKNQQRLMDQFKAQAVDKTYIAFVHGQLDQLEGEIKFAIKDKHQQQFAQRTRAKKALTRYRVVQEFDDFSVVEAKPITGRTNQIRIHFARLGHPLVGESVYAFRKDFALKFKRCALHAATLGWKDIQTHQSMTVHAPLPQDMENFLIKQRKDS